MTARTVAIIDGNSLLHRAFHALPITLTGVDGRPTNAVYGFASMLFGLVEKLGPDGVVAGFDLGRPAFRTEVLGQYKMHRPPTAQELKDQFPMVKQLLEVMRIPVIEQDGWEGDDILGTLARQASERGVKCLLITGDRDAMQLVTEDVLVVTSKRGMSELVVYGPKEVLERFGVTPAQIPDYLGLKGDTSDNIPGVPGIGEKTAAKLMGEYGSLEEVIAHAGEVRGKIGENLRSHVQDALDSRLVATIRTDVPIACDLESVTWGEWDPAQVLPVMKEYRFTSLVSKMIAHGNVVVSELESDATDLDLGFEALPLVTGPEATRRALSRFEDIVEVWTGVAVDIDSGCLLPTSTCALAFGDEACVIEEADVGSVLRAAFERGRLASGDIKACLMALCDEEGDIVLDAADPSRLFDCGIAAYLLESHRSSYDAVTLAAEEFGGAPEAVDDDSARAALQAHASALLAPRLSERLDAEGARECFERCEMPLVPVLARMERIGVALDSAMLEEMSTSMGARIESLLAEIYELAGEEFNVDSPKQLGAVLFDKLGLPPGKRKKTGYSTDSSVLGPLAVDWPIAGKVLEYRELNKLKSTYVDALPRLLGEDGRLHTTFNQTVAATGRLSSSSPNLQNIPVRSEIGRTIRAAFVPGEGFDLIMSADYSQIELRILAHLSGDAGLIEAFTSGADFHTATASRVFGVDPSDVDPGLRSRAKATNFGIVYGISAHGLSVQLGIGRDEAQGMIDRYFEAYPDVRHYLDHTIEEARRLGYAETMFGRRRYIPELKSSAYTRRAFGERTAMNHPMQGAASDIMKLAMIETDRRLRESGMRSRLVIQVHDELVFEAVKGEVGALKELARDAMSGVIELAVPLVVDVAQGIDWAQAK